MGQSPPGQRERLPYIYHLMSEVKGFVGRRASRLSGGLQKLVALPRALMSGTKLLLLDEPFEGQSPAMGEKLAGTILALQRDGLSNEAALTAARVMKNRVEIADFDDAIDRVVAGLERKSRVITPKEKEIVAHHEADMRSSPRRAPAPTASTRSRSSRGEPPRWATGFTSAVDTVDRGNEIVLGADLPGLEQKDMR